MHLSNTSSKATRLYPYPILRRVPANAAAFRPRRFSLRTCLLAWSLFAPGGAMAANTVNINDGNSYTNIFGNYDGQGATQTGADPTTGPSSGNGLTVSPGVEVRGAVVGGQGVSGAMDAGTNTVIINGVTFSNGSDYGVFGGYTTGGNANGNAVTVKALTGDPLSNVIGGVSESGGNANNNTVTVNAGTIVGITGGSSNTGTADSNTVIATGGTISGSIRGGNGGTSANSNRVTIDAAFTGSIGGNIYGGTTGSGSTTNNTVTINTNSWTFSGGINVDGTWVTGGSAAIANTV